MPSELPSSSNPPFTNSSITKPLPDSATASGEDGASLFTVSVPVRGPTALGEKVTSTKQLSPTLSENGAAGHVPPVTEKSPLAPTAITARGSEPVLDSVIDWAALVVPTCWLPKSSDAVDRLKAGWTPV